MLRLILRSFVYAESQLRLLLDTHILLRAAGQPEKLSESTRILYLCFDVRPHPLYDIALDYGYQYGYDRGVV